MAPLSAAEVRQYHEQGYLVPGFRMPDARGAAARGAGTADPRQPDVRPEKLVSAHLARRGGQANAEGVRGQAAFLDRHGPADPRRRGAADRPGHHPLGLPRVLQAGRRRSRDALAPGRHYWPIRPLANCTVWVALEESTVDNGCLRVIPRSHLAKLSHPHLHEDRQDLALQQRPPTTASTRRPRSTSSCSLARCRCTTST